MVGLQQAGWLVGAHPQLLPCPPPLNRSRMPASAVALSTVMATNALQNRIHFMEQYLLPLGFSSWAVLTTFCVGECFVRRRCPSAFRISETTGDMRRFCPTRTNKQQEDTDGNTVFTSLITFKTRHRGHEAVRASKQFLLGRSMDFPSKVA